MVLVHNFPLEITMLYTILLFLPIAVNQKPEKKIAGSPHFCIVHVAGQVIKIVAKNEPLFVI